MKKRLVILAGLLMAACGGAVPVPEAQRYDFGSAPAGAAVQRARLPLAALDVQAASWLSGPDMHFRLAYADPLRRRSYAESRWAAPPAELLETFLKRQLVYSGAEHGSAGCRLQVVLDEFEQRFDDAQGSRLVIEARIQLTGPRGAEALSRRAFAVQKAATPADARGGAMAARDAVQALADDLAGWLGDLSRDRPVLVERCRS